MSAETKAVNLTEEEIRMIIGYHGNNLVDYIKNEVNDNLIDRINYLNKRLKAFNEDTPKPAAQPNNEAQQIAQGWGQTNG
jgi:chaperonin cofactor prefoldin